MPVATCIVVPTTAHIVLWGLLPAAWALSSARAPSPPLDTEFLMITDSAALYRGNALLRRHPAAAAV